MEVRVNLMIPSLLPQERKPCIRWIGSWMGPRACTDVLEKRIISFLCWNSKSIRSSVGNEECNFRTINFGEASSHSEIHCILWNHTFHNPFRKIFSCSLHSKLAKLSPRTHTHSFGSILRLLFHLRHAFQVSFVDIQNILQHLWTRLTIYYEWGENCHHWYSLHNKSTFYCSTMMKTIIKLQEH
jgi:hypothetical protein